MLSDWNNATYDGVAAGSITSVNSKGTKIESSTITLPSEDLSDYSTVLYVDSKAGTGVENGVAAEANSQKVIKSDGTSETCYATNLLVYGTEVAVIDVNEIAGSAYGAKTLPGNISGLTDVQWLNTRTGGTDEGKAYKGAVMELSFYAEKGGKLVLKNVQSVDANQNTGAQEVTLTVKGGEHNKFDSLIVTGNNNVTATFTADGSTTPDPTDVAVTIDELLNAKALVYGGTTQMTLNYTVENAGGKTPAIKITNADGADKTGDFSVSVMNRITTDEKVYPSTTINQKNDTAAGKCTVALTVGDVTKTVEFTVEKKKVAENDMTITAPTVSGAATQATVTGFTAIGISKAELEATTFNNRVLGSNCKYAVNLVVLANLHLNVLADQIGYVLSVLPNTLSVVILIGGSAVDLLDRRHRDLVLTSGGGIVDDEFAGSVQHAFVGNEIHVLAADGLILLNIGRRLKAFDVLGVNNVLHVERVVQDLRGKLTRQRSADAAGHVCKQAVRVCVAHGVGNPSSALQTDLVGSIAGSNQHHLGRFHTGNRSVRCKRGNRLAGDNAAVLQVLDVALGPVAVHILERGGQGFICAGVVIAAVEHGEDHLCHLRAGNSCLGLERTVGITIDYTQSRQRIHSFGCLNVSRIRECRTGEHRERASEREHQCENLFLMAGKRRIFGSRWVMIAYLHGKYNFFGKSFCAGG